MANIQEVELNDTFLTFMEKTNATVELVNMQISDEQLARLTTDDKKTIVGAINEINKNMLNTKGGTVEGNLTTAGYLSSNTFIRVGSNNNGDTIIYLYDDKRNVYKMLKWNNEKDDLTIEDNNGNHNKVLHENQTIDCSSMGIDLQQKSVIKNINDASVFKEGQLIYLLDNNHVVIHDGSKKGGYTIVNMEDIVDLRKVKISDADTTAMFLKDKVIAGTGVKLEKTNSSSNEQLKIKTGLYPGLINFWPGAITTIPDGWALCNGQPLDRSKFAELYSIIGTSYGSGNGTTTFNIPNYCGKFLFGADESTSWKTVGGEKTHKLTVSELPSHKHSIYGNGNASTASNVDGTYDPVSAKSLNSCIQHYAASSHRLAPVWSTLQKYEATNVIQNTGGNSAHNNMPPYQTGFWIIFTNIFGVKFDTSISSNAVTMDKYFPIEVPSIRPV